MSDAEGADDPGRSPRVSRDVRDADSSFLEEALLSYLLPAATDVELEDLFRNIDQSKPVLDSIPRRDAVFFGTFIFSRSQDKSRRQSSILPF